jgi:hypothetical protein
MMKSCHQPEIFAAFPNIIAAQSTRHGGVSPKPLSSLNLSFSVGDTEANVQENRKRFFGTFQINPAEVATSKQIHQDKVLYAPEPGAHEGFDALVTDQRRVFVAVSIADCTPILLFDAAHRVVAAVHAGWRGTAEGIVYKTLQAMQGHFGTNAADCFAYVGTCIDECSYEVNADVADHFPDDFKRFDAAKQKFFVDLKASNRYQMEAFGVPTEQIEISSFSTVLHNEDFFSHRKEKGKTGRMMAFIGIK